ncbi:MAG: hypothetical protein LBL04_09160 [Bacteroidales bacterium]|jgi:hypothetical protein|nr:hypothetical protein [Bacteroidales bacterium]
MNKIGVKNLSLAATAFLEEWWLPYIDSFSMLGRQIKEGTINKEYLKDEFLSAINDKDFDWMVFAKESHLLMNPANYTNIEICNYVKFLFFDYLFPEKKLSNEQLNHLGKEIACILRISENKDNDDWVFSYDLYDMLKKQKIFKDLEYHNLWNVPYRSFQIELKSIENKDREIGFLRYQDSGKNYIKCLNQ